jgi:hypothetical protein
MPDYLVTPPLSKPDLVETPRVEQLAVLQQVLAARLANPRSATISPAPPGRSASNSPRSRSRHGRFLDNAPINPL